MAPPHVNQAANLHKLRYKSIPSTSSPINKILHLVEIVENILKCVPMRDLVVDTQWACKAFHGVINTSPTLQKVLWKMPESSATAWTVDDDGGIHPLQSLTQKHEPNAFSNKPKERSIQTYVLNPLLLEIFRKRREIPVEDRIRFSADNEPRYSRCAELNQATSKLLNKPSLKMASYYDMQLCQPALQNISISYDKVYDCGGKNYFIDDYMTMQKEEGITFGDLINALNSSAYGTKSMSIEYTSPYDGIPITVEEQAELDGKYGA